MDGREFVSTTDDFKCPDGANTSPAGWAWSTIDAVTERVATIDPRRLLSNEAINYVDLGAIGPMGSLKPTRLLGREAPSRARQLIVRGDTLYSCVRVYLGNIAFVESDIANAVASTAFCVLRPNEQLDPRFLHYYVRSERFRLWMIPLQRGNSPPAVVDSDVKSRPIPLPPLAEQKRIVARIDELFAEIAEGEAALNRAREGLETFRRALLKSAVTGELTREWREGRPFEPSSSNSDALTNLSETPRRLRTPRNGGVIALDEALLPQLPASWAWKPLGDIVSHGPTNGYSPKASNDGTGTPSLKLTATTSGRMRLDTASTKRLSETIDPTSDLFLRPGDLLFQRGNTIEYVGISAIYDGPPATYVYPDLMIRVRTSTSQLSEWIWRVANSPFGRKFMMDYATGTAGTMPKISGAILRRFPVPLPTGEEAAEILRRVSAALAAHADTLALIDAEAADAARLRQAVLKAAFEGRLVSQDPDDEPASAMLERLASTDPRPKTNKRGRPRKT